MYRVLKDMLTTFDKAEAIYKPSLFWQDINKLHIEQLENDGYNNFKQTLNLKYFNFIVSIIDRQFLKLVKYLIKHPTLKVFTARLKSFRLCKDNNLLTKFTGRILYPVFIAMLWEYTRSIDYLELLEQINEPLEGNPIKVWYKGRLISQDVCNSIIEYYAIPNAMAIEKLSVCELGAGYGRLAYVFLKARNCRNIKYTVVDIPPALYVAQRYLTEVFPMLKAFKFRDFGKYEDVKEEFETAAIRFLEPQQVKLLPPFQFNLFINISSLHEMTMPQIQNYINMIDQYTNGYFYTKQWIRSINVKDKIVVGYKDYPIPSAWKELYWRKCEVQSLFFEALYKIGGK